MYESRENLIVSHGFSDQRVLSLSDEQIAYAACQLKDEYAIPWIAQYPQQFAVPINKQPIAVIKEHLLRRGKYLDSEEVNRQVAKICRHKGWEKIILIAHPHHAWRAGKNLEHHGLHVIFASLDNIGYDSKMKRWELASPWAFIPREILARFLYLAKGYLF